MPLGACVYCGGGQSRAGISLLNHVPRQLPARCSVLHMPEGTCHAPCSPAVLAEIRSAQACAWCASAAATPPQRATIQSSCPGPSPHQLQQPWRQLTQPPCSIRQLAGKLMAKLQSSCAPVLRPSIMHSAGADLLAWSCTALAVQHAAVILL